MAALTARVDSSQARLPVKHLQRGGAWKPGQSGNPKGRPPEGYTIAELARAITRDGQIPIAFLADVCLGKVPGAKVTDRVLAANSLLDRAWGRPIQAVAHGGPDGGAIPVALLGISEMSDAELVELIRRGMRSVVVEGTTVAVVDSDEKAALATDPASGESS